MRCVLDRRQFLATYQRVAGFANKNAIQQPLRSVKFVCSDEPELIATDLQSGIRCHADGVTVQEGGVILLSDRFGQILSSSTEDQVTLSLAGSNLLIADQSGKFTIATEDAQHFPDLTSNDFADCWTVYAQELRTLIRRTIFACDPDSTRYALGGCLFETANGSLALVATDGRCLARATAKVELTGSPTATRESVVPQKGLKLIDRLLDSTGPIRIAIDGTSAWFDTGTETAWIQLLEGRFPKYQDIVPAGKTDVVTLSAEMLAAEISRARVVSSEDSCGIDLAFTDDMLSISAQSSDVGCAAIQVPISYSGKHHTITIDPQYTLPALKAVTGDITLEILSAKEAVQIKADGFQFVQMPLTRDAA